jgi:hypothetical protein
VTAPHRPGRDRPPRGGHPALKSFLLVAGVTLVIILLAALSTFGGP